MQKMLDKQFSNRREELFLDEKINPREADIFVSAVALKISNLRPQTIPRDILTSQKKLSDKIFCAKTPILFCSAKIFL